MAYALTINSVEKLTGQTVRVNYTLTDPGTIYYDSLEGMVGGSWGVGSVSGLTEGTHDLDLECTPGWYTSVGMTLVIDSENGGYDLRDLGSVAVDYPTPNTVALGPVDIDGSDVSVPFYVTDLRSDFIMMYTYVADAAFADFPEVSPDAGNISGAGGGIFLFILGAGTPPYTMFLWGVYDSSGSGYVEEVVDSSLDGELVITQDNEWSYGEPAVLPPSIDSIGVAYDGTEVTFTINTTAGTNAIASQVIEYETAGDTDSFVDGVPITYDYLTISERTATITVTDTASNTVQQQATVWGGDTDPTASLSTPSYDGTEVTITPTFADADHDIVSAVLDMGDESTPIDVYGASGTPVVYDYGSIANRTVTLTVTDAKSNVVTAEVDVWPGNPLTDSYVVAPIADSAESESATSWEDLWPMYGGFPTVGYAISSDHPGGWPTTWYQQTYSSVNALSQGQSVILAYKVRVPFAAASFYDAAHLYAGGGGDGRLYVTSTSGSPVDVGTQSTWHLRIGYHDGISWHWSDDDAVQWIKAYFNDGFNWSILPKTDNHTPSILIPSSVLRGTDCTIGYMLTGVGANGLGNTGLRLSPFCPLLVPVASTRRRAINIW